MTIYEAKTLQGVILINCMQIFNNILLTAEDVIQADKFFNNTGTPDKVLGLGCIILVRHRYLQGARHNSAIKVKSVIVLTNVWIYEIKFRNVPM